MVADYKGLIWPFQVTTQGDAAKGSFSDVVKSDIRTVLQTRRFIGLGRGGERVMRPSAFGIVPGLLFERTDYEVLIPLVRTWVEEALQILVREGKIVIKNIFVTPRENPIRLHIRIEYFLKNDGTQDFYESDIGTFRPSESSVI